MCTMHFPQQNGLVKYKKEFCFIPQESEKASILLVINFLEELLFNIGFKYWFSTFFGLTQNAVDLMLKRIMAFFSVESISESPNMFVIKFFNELLLNIGLVIFWHQLNCCRINAVVPIKAHLSRADGVV